jgi:hypothetical protein
MCPPPQPSTISDWLISAVSTPPSHEPSLVLLLLQIPFYVTPVTSRGLLLVQGNLEDSSGLMGVYSIVSTVGGFVGNAIVQQILALTTPDEDYRTIPIEQRKADTKTNAASFYMGAMCAIGAAFAVYLVRSAGNGTLHLDFEDANETMVVDNAGDVLSVNDIDNAGPAFAVDEGKLASENETGIA